MNGQSNQQYHVISINQPANPWRGSSVEQDASVDQPDFGIFHLPSNTRYTSPQSRTSLPRIRKLSAGAGIFSEPQMGVHVLWLRYFDTQGLQLLKLKMELEWAPLAHDIHLCSPAARSPLIQCTMLFLPQFLHPKNPDNLRDFTCTCTCLLRLIWRIDLKSRMNNLKCKWWRLDSVDMLPSSVYPTIFMCCDQDQSQGS